MYPIFISLPLYSSTDEKIDCLINIGFIKSVVPTKNDETFIVFSDENKSRCRLSASAIKCRINEGMKNTYNVI